MGLALLTTRRRWLALGVGPSVALSPFAAAAADATPATVAGGAGLIGTMSTGAGSIRERLAEVIVAARDLPALFAAAGTWLGQDENRRILATTILLASLVLVAGVILEIVSRALLRRAGLSSEAGPPAGTGKLARLFMRLTVDLFAIAAFAIGSVGALLILYDQDDAVFPLLLLLVSAVVALRLIAVAHEPCFARARPQRGSCHSRSARPRGFIAT